MNHHLVWRFFSFSFILFPGDEKKENPLISKTNDFGSRIVRLHQYLIKTKHEATLSKQILRSSTSIGANINEAQYANSKADFIA